MAQPHHTKARKETRRAHAATEFPQYPAATYTPHPYTTRISQPINQSRNGASRQTRRPQITNVTNDSFASHSQKALSTVWRGRRGLSLRMTRNILKGIFAAIIVSGIILLIIYTVKHLDKSR